MAEAERETKTIESVERFIEA